MAISEDRLKVAEITKATTSNFNETIDKPLEEFENSFNSVSQSIEGTINDSLTGYEKKTSKLLEDVTPKNLSFNTKSLGVFENLLCGKLPSLNLRLPSFKTDIFPDLNFGFNMKICGKSKQVNPMDAALSVVDAIKNPSNVVSELKGDVFDKLVSDNLKDTLRGLGISGLPDCIMDTSRWDAAANNDIFGSSLNDKMDINNLVNKFDGCAGDVARQTINSSSISRVTNTSILSKLSGTSKYVASNGMSAMIAKNSYSAASGTSRMLGSDNNQYIDNQVYMVSNNYATNDDIDFKAILQNDEFDHSGKSPSLPFSVRTASLDESNEDITKIIGLKDRVTADEVIALRTDSTNMFNSIGQVDLNYDDPKEKLKEIVMTANVIDPYWNRDQQGNLSLYKTSNNINMKKLADQYITSNENKIEINNALTGTVTTDLNAAHHISIINSFDNSQSFKV